MRPVVLDFETFHTDALDEWGVPYKFKHMGGPGRNTEDYVRHPWFEAHGAAIKWSASTSAVWYDQRELAYILKEEDWSDVLLIAHHCQFDGLVLTHHYDVHPKMWGCTLSMARLVLGNHLSPALEMVRRHFGMPSKTTPYNLFKGKRHAELSDQTRTLVGEGACDEAESIWKIFGLLMQQGFPTEELEIVDSTIRMLVEPELIGDTAVFAKVWQDENTRRTAALERLGVTAKDLGSDETFASLLRARGVEPETKVTDKGNTKFAFAKTDTFMEELQQNEDDEVRALAEARLGTKSTLLQTRAATLGWMASRGPLCVYLRYCGAHTSRWSGGDDTNFQNWTNGSEINSGVVAPDGYLIAEPDASQIECRLLNFCAGQRDKVEEFRSGADPYIGVASKFYGFPVNKKDHPDERQLGKIVELQAGYQSGGNKIRATVRIKSGGKILLTPAEGVQARDAYRNTHPAVVEYWKYAGYLLDLMGSGNNVDMRWGPFQVVCDIQKKTKRIVLPNGIELKYDTLDYYADHESGDTYWRIKTRNGWTKIYSGKLVENVIQALARVVVSQVLLRLKKLGYRCKNTKHDSLWLLVPIDDRLEEHKETILREMSRTPDWLPGVPLAAEFKGIGTRMTW